MEDESKELTQENSETLKSEIKKELKEEFLNLRHKRKRRILKTAGVFILGLIIGFGGGAATHSVHYFNSHGHLQNWHHMQQ